MISKGADDLESRIVVACCRLFPGIRTPAECRRLLEAGEISVNDFLTALDLAVREAPSTIINAVLASLAGAKTPVPPILEWLFPESEQTRNERASQAMSTTLERLLMLAKPADERAAEHLKQIQEQLSKSKEEPSGR